MGLGVGEAVGRGVGDNVSAVGAGVGDNVSAVGPIVGESVGITVGDSVVSASPLHLHASLFCGLHPSPPW